MGGSSSRGDNSNRGLREIAAIVVLVVVQPVDFSRCRRVAPLFSQSEHNQVAKCTLTNEETGIRQVAASDVLMC